MTQNLAQNADALDAAQAAAAKSTRECQCGNFANAETGERIDCEAATARNFAPGHDAKLKSFLIRTGAAGDLVRQLGVADAITAVQAANLYGFGNLVSAGIIKAAEKAEARANRPARRTAAKRATPADADLTHDGNAARRQREAAGLAEIVAAEEAKHAAVVAASRPEPEWDDADEVKVAPAILEDEGAMNAHAREAREAAGLVKAKVGRWEHEGYVNDDGSFTYAKRSGGTKTAVAGKFTLI